MSSTNRWYRTTWDPGTDISPAQTEFATAQRVPFLSSPYPRRGYISGIVVDDTLWHGIVPTNEEVEVVAGVIRSYLDYFFPKPNAFRQEMEEFAPYDVDNGAVAFYFIKKPDGSWAYRRHTWQDSYTFRPGYDETPLTLAEVIERGDLRWRRR